MTASFHRVPQLSRRTLLGGGVATAVLTLLGCGGGDSGIAGVGTGGTGSFSSGPIRGFGSILVGDVHYEEVGATVVGDGGGASNAAALRLGVVVEVQGFDIETAADGKRRADAASIAVRSEIEGPISAVDLANRSFTVLGQEIHVTPGTVFDDDLPDGLAGLSVGDLVEVYGLLQADGHYTATRIDDEDDDADHYKLRGRISGLDVEGSSFRIGTTVVSYAGLGGSVPVLENGQYVRVELLKTPDAGTGAWRASRLDVFNAGINPPQTSGLKVEIEGYITRFDSATRFAVSGIEVDASKVRWLPAGLAQGMRVEVEGVLVDGILHASEVELDDDDDEFEIEGSISHVDPVAQTLQILGITVDYSGARFKHGSADDLAPGVRIEVEGRLAADGRTLLASEIEFDDDDDEFEIEGRIDSVSPGNQTFVLGGITVDYSRAEFEHGTAADLAPGVKVEVEGRRSADGKTLVASEVEFDD